ncbi:MAG: serine protein kinase RIO [Candidatus Woesearchaeota archaeon]
MTRVTKERFKTYKDVFDNHTERALFRLSGQGHFDRLLGPVSIGKEANIFTVLRKDPEEDGDAAGGSMAIAKIYRLETCEFNRMYDYMRYDPRYEGMKRSKRKIIFSWCQREFRNLFKAREAGVNVPTPFVFRDNILLMELIGRKPGSNEPAPKLKDMHPDNPERFYEMLMDQINSFYKSGMVHGDLSEYNILNQDGKPSIIDLSQATPIKSSNAEDLLKRDAKNTARFFNKLGLDITEKDAEDRIKLA